VGGRAQVRAHRGARSVRPAQQPEQRSRPGPTCPQIIKRGAAWFASIGTAGSKAPRSLAGGQDQQHGAGWRCPWGIPLREIIYDIAAASRATRSSKRCSRRTLRRLHPRQPAGLKVDYDELTKAGSMMGSGGMIVMDEDTCMVTWPATPQLPEGESCGSAWPAARVRRMLEIVERITSGRGELADLDTLQELGELPCRHRPVRPGPPRRPTRF